MEEVAEILINFLWILTFYFVLKMMLNWRTNLWFITQMKSKLEIMFLLFELCFLLLPVVSPVVLVKIDEERHAFVPIMIYLCGHLFWVP